MDRQLGLDGEARRGEREGFHEAPRHDAVAAQHVLELDAEHQRGQPGQHPVAQDMAGAIGRGVGVHPPAGHQVELLGDELGYQLGRLGRVIGVVAVGQHIDVGLHVGEHPAHDVAFALPPLVAHDGARLARHLGGAVLRIVVVDIDLRQRQGGAEGPHRGADRRLLVVAGQEDGDAGCRLFRFGHGRGHLNRGQNS